MRAIEEGHFQRAMDRLLQKHGARLRFLDLMGPPGEALRDPRYFTDPDHMRAEGADLVGRTVGAWLAPQLR
jgi:lysophospholipase L1-like esterase